MDFNDFEDKLLVELQANITGIEIRSYPDDFDRYISQLTHPGGAILIAFQGGTWDTPEGNNQSVLVQTGVFNWQFTVLVQSLKRLKNDTAMYDRLEEIRQALSGFTPAGFNDSSVLYPVDVGFLDRVYGWYAYQITMAHTIEESEV